MDIDNEDINVPGICIQKRGSNAECNKNRQTIGMDLNIYTKGLTPELLPNIKKRFADFAMDIEFHPDFKFHEHMDSGFCPIKLKIQKGHSTHYDNFGKEVLTGFELYFDNYKYQKKLEQNQNLLPKKIGASFLSKLFTSKRDRQETYVVNRDIDKHLRHCDRTLTINWQTGNKSELRISLFFGAILAELTDGIIYDPQNGRYLTGKQALKTFPLEVKDYEDSFNNGEFVLYKFENWN